MDRLTQDLLREVFDYDHETGDLIFKAKDSMTAENRRWNTRYAGRPCGSENSQGYLHVKLLGKKEKVHRMVFLFHKGYLPDVIDHADNDKLNNRIENLREATRSENNRNARRRADNKSGIKGVTWHNQHQKWYATIRCEGKAKFLGLFANKVAADTAVKKARVYLHGEYLNHG